MSDIKDRIVDKFVKGEQVMPTGCFNEYCFIIPEGVIKPEEKPSATYCPGDTLPMTGESYMFPRDLNIIDLHTKLVAKIRDNKFFDLVNIREFDYDGLPSLNIMGFFIKLNSTIDYEDFIMDFMSLKGTEREKVAVFANKWFEIVKYRSIRYK